MTTEYVQRGESIDFTPVADVAAGDVIVQGELVGVAKKDIKANELGALAVEGVFDFPKATGASTAITVGSDVYWDAGLGEASTNAAAGANKLIGKTVLDAADADAFVRVRLNQ